jgi:diguanylate cyclase (GGDEF)-like protein/PAS domain S-box-containing protein
MVSFFPHRYKVLHPFRLWWVKEKCRVFNELYFLHRLSCENNTWREGTSMSSGNTSATNHDTYKKAQNPTYDSLWRGVSSSATADLQARTLALVSHGLMVADATQPGFPLLYVNQAFCTMTGFTPKEVLGREYDKFLQGSETNPESLESIRQALSTGQPCTVVLENYRKDCRLFWNELSLTPLHDETGEVTHFVGVQHDVTTKIEAEQNLLQAKRDLERTTLELAQVTLELERVNAKYYHDALHDALTGLANRSLLYDRLEHLLERDKRHPGIFAVLYLDLDGFKRVNDLFGHAVGDKLLVGVAERLKSCVRPSDTIARLGGDEFAVLLDGLERSEEATLIAERIQKVIAQSFVIAAHTLHVSSSIGIALNSPDYSRSADLLRDADVAMYNAKQSGKDQVVIFESSMRSRTGTLEVDLRGALNKGELSVHYQPILSTQTRTLTGFEALVRWHHPSRGELKPDGFIPLAEETGLIIAIDRYVLRESCKQIKTWQEQWGRDFSLNVNLSGYQLFRQDLVPYLKSVLEETGFEAGQLRLELTESVMLNFGQAVQKRLHDVCDLGVQLYIDDFGKGYSSLGYLQNLPSKTLKIDRSFTERVDRGFEGEELVRTIVVMAHNLGMTVVAEGIESQNQLELVSTLGCEFVQGYFFSPPLAPRDVEKFVFEAKAIALGEDKRVQTKK